MDQSIPQNSSEIPQQSQEVLERGLPSQKSGEGVGGDSERSAEAAHNVATKESVQEYSIHEGGGGWGTSQHS